MSPAELLQGILGATPITPETSIDALPLDSLDFLDLILELENLYGITITYQELAEVKTVGDLLRVVDSLRTAIHLQS